MSGQRLFLMISDQVVTAYTWSGNRFAPGESFPQNDEGCQAFDRFLDNTLRGEDYLLADLTEEELRAETIPLLHGPNRQEMIRRQLDRLFRNGIYRRADSQGVNKQEKQERLLFSALLDPTLVSPWVEILIRRQRRLMGIWSLPLLCRTVLRQLNRRTDQALLVSRNSGGLRLTFFHRGRTTVSRLTPVHDDTPEGILEEMRLEVEKTRSYLNSLRLLNQEIPLEIFLLDHGPLWPHMAKSCAAMDAMGGGHFYRCQPVDGRELGHMLGMNQEMEHTAGLDLLFGQMLFKDRPKNHYARPADLRHHHTLLARQWIQRATWSLPLVGALVGAVPFMNGLMLRDDLPALSNAITQARHQLQRVEENALPTPLPGLLLEEAVTLHQALLREQATPREVMVAISQVLTHHPTLRLDKMSWKMANDPQATIAEGSTSPAKSGEPSGEPPTDLFHIVLLDGQVTPFHGNYRDAIEKIDLFLTEIRHHPQNREAKATTLPIDLSHAGGASGTAGLASSDDGPRQARFQIRLVLGVDHGQP